jgi:flagellar FliL protein
MATDVPKKDDPPAAANAKPKGKRKKLILIVVAAVAVLAIGAGALLFLLAGPSGEHKEAKPQPVKAPLFVNLEPFTVNLQPEDGDKFLQVITTLKIADKAVEDRVKVYMPEMRHRILLLLSGKKPSQIGTPEGRELLATEIRDELNRILAIADGKNAKASTPTKPIGKVSATFPADNHTGTRDGAVTGVLFTSFIIQ